MPKKKIKPAIVISLLYGLICLTVSDFAFAFPRQHGLFGNVTIRDDNLNRHESNPFTTQLDIYSADKIHGNLSYLMEFVIEKNDEHQEAHMERLHLDYSFSDELRLSFGQFHSPIGYWNRTFHHGRILHDTVERPFFLDFEHNSDASFVMPVHYIGMMLDGVFETNTEQWKYELAIGNGPEINTEKFDDHHRPEIEPGSSINQNNLSLSYHMSYHPEEQPYHFGFFLMRNEIQEAGSLANNSITQHEGKLTDQDLYGIEATYRLNNFDLIAEHFWFRHTQQADRVGAFNASAFYIQLGYQLSSPLKVTYRYSELDFEEGDLYFNILDSEEQYHNLLSLRYDLNEFNTLKFEADQQRSKYDNQDDIYTFRLQWSFLLNNPLSSYGN